MLDDGTVDLFTWYDCVGKTTAPCNESDSLESVVTGDAAPELGTVFQPSQTVLHIPDPEGRAISSVSGSTALVWSTGVADFTGLPGGKDRPGAVVAVNNKLLNYMPTTANPGNWGTDHTQWTNWHLGRIQVTAVVPTDDQGNALGEIKGWRKTNPPDELFWGNDVDPNDATAPTLLMDYDMYLGDSNEAVGGWRDERYIEFSAMGTYLLTVTITFAYDDDGDDNTTAASYSDTETFTFHVGPLTDLSVASGTSDMPAGQTAFTIRAANNGPDHEVDATVKVVLPTGALVEDYVASDGTYSNGVWTLPGLKLRDYRRSQGKPEEATLTLILKEGSGIPQEPAEGTISLTDNAYTVCIASNRSTLGHTNRADCKADSATTDVWHSAVCVQDSDQTVNTTSTHNTQAKCGTQTGHTWTANVCATSAGKVISGRAEPECDGWHTGTIYEHDSGNNTAKITAVKGTGGIAPAAPRFANRPVLTWEPVPHVNNWPVHRYQVQHLRSNSWVDLADVLGSQTHFTDTDSSSGRSYRVRAMNEAGVGGVWSRTASRTSHRQASPPLNVRAETGAAGEIVVSWDPSTDDEGSPITHYQVQWSRSGTGGWSNACRSDGPSDLSCTHTGIPAGETRYYRVAAHTAQGLGAWSDFAVATTIPGVPSAPRSLSASRAPQDLGGETIRAIRLTWSAPATDNGSSIFRYHIDYVDYDQSAGRCGTDWQYLGSDPSVHSNEPPTREYLDTGEYHWVGLEPGAYRCYRVQAVNSAGEGPFSNVARASAGGEVPPEWVYLDGEADGQNAITLYWGEPYYDGGAPVTSYQLQYSADGENWRNLTSTSGSARSYTHTGRKVGETWHYRIRARNSAGWSEWSYPIAVTIEEGATANIAQPSLTARATSSTEVLLSWNSLCNPNKEDDCENKGIDGYMVQYAEDGGAYGWETLTWFWTDQTKFLDSAVEPGATRYYRVAGYQEEDRRQLFGRWSQAKSVTTVDFVVGAPQNFTITAEGERGLKLVWDEVTNGRDASSITGYRIERNTCCGDGTDFDTTWVARQTNRKSNTYVETGLTPGTDYYYRVAAVTRNGSVPWIGPWADIERFFIPPPGG